MICFVSLVAISKAKTLQNHVFFSNEWFCFRRLYHLMWVSIKEQNVWDTRKKMKICYHHISLKMRKMMQRRMPMLYLEGSLQTALPLNGLVLLQVFWQTRSFGDWSFCMKSYFLKCYHFTIVLPFCGMSNKIGSFHNTHFIITHLSLGSGMTNVKI